MHSFVRSLFLIKLIKILLHYIIGKSGDRIASLYYQKTSKSRLTFESIYLGFLYLLQLIETRYQTKIATISLPGVLNIKQLRITKISNNEGANPMPRPPT
jgi:hypothetical protein